MNSCPGCGGTNFKRSAYPGAERQQRELRFDSLDVCAACGLGIAWPRPSQEALDAYYAGGAYWDTAGTTPAQSLHARNQCEHRARFVAGRAPSALNIRVLDIGAGEAWLGTALRKYVGARITDYDYVEPDSRLRGLPRPQVGPKHRAFSSLAEVKGPYEIVFLNQVLEHVADPAALFGRTVELLTPEGILYVESPNADYRFKPDVFPHTLFFTADSLRRIGERSGFETLACEPFGRSVTAGTGFRDLAARVGYRVACSLGAQGLAQRFDDAYWHYEPDLDGLWLRWLGRRPA